MCTLTKHCPFCSLVLHDNPFVVYSSIFVLFRLCSWASVQSPFWELRWWPVAIYVFSHCLLWWDFKDGLGDCLRAFLSSPKLERLGSDLVSLVIICTVFVIFFDTKTILYFFPSIAVSVLTPIFRCLGTINKLKARNFCGNPSAAAWCRNALFYICLTPLQWYPRLPIEKLHAQRRY